MIGLNTGMETTWEVTLITRGTTIYFGVIAATRKQAENIARDWNPGCRILKIERQKQYS